MSTVVSSSLGTRPAYQGGEFCRTCTTVNLALKCLASAETCTAAAWHRLEKSTGKRMACMRSMGVAFHISVQAAFHLPFLRWDLNTRSRADACSSLPSRTTTDSAYFMRRHDIVLSAVCNATGTPRHRSAAADRSARQLLLQSRLVRPCEPFPPSHRRISASDCRIWSNHQVVDC